MDQHNSIPHYSLSANEDNHFKRELKIVGNSLLERPKTMRMVEVETGILRPNICRHIAALRKLKNIVLVYKGHCPYTKRTAGFYSTNLSVYEYVKGGANGK